MYLIFIKWILPKAILKHNSYITKQKSHLKNLIKFKNDIFLLHSYAFNLHSFFLFNNLSCRLNQSIKNLIFTSVSSHLINRYFKQSRIPKILQLIFSCCCCNSISATDGWNGRYIFLTFTEKITTNWIFFQHQIKI